MCTICAALRPYTDLCDYDGLIAVPPADAEDNQPTIDQTDGFTEEEFDALLETVLQANDFSYDVWPFSPPTGPIQMTYSFETGATADFPWTNVGGGFSAYTAAEQAAVRRALDEYERVLNIEFVEAAPGGDADLAFFQAGDLNTDVSAVYGGRGSWRYRGDDWDGWAMFNSARDLSQERDFDLILHEIGHALGLRHPGNYDVGGGGPSGPYLPTELDNDQYSIMSYFNNTIGNLESSELMLLDIAALQAWWGANTSYATGDDTYLARGVNQFHVIWDAGGTDVIQHFTGEAQINLRPGAFSTLSGNTELVIGRGVEIENAQTGAWHDTIIGNDLANMLEAGAGNDTVEGGDGNDSILGESGNDSLEGGFGMDTLIGGGGFDTMRGGQHGDTLLGGDGADSLYGDNGNDRLDGGNGFDQLFGGNSNDTMFGGAIADRLYGGNGNDFMSGGSNFGITVDGLWGEAGDDTIYGDGGFDLLDGGTGNDYMDGGAQADNLYGRIGEDTLLGGGGLDRLFGGADDDTLDGGAGNDGLFGEQGNDVMIGGTGNDRFFAGQGNDDVQGGANNDTINGGAGFDTIDGGTGNDVIFGRFNADTFVFTDGHGVDVIGDFNALNNFERIDFSGLSTINNLADMNLASTTLGAATQVGGNVLIDTGGGNQITLSGVSLSDLDGFDFIF